jgi:hypothetical protein
MTALNIKIAALTITGLLLFLIIRASNTDVTTSKDAVDAVPAFPGAMGGGKYTSGGRGGQVLSVTNLNDNGPGSLRKAIETPGARTIIFEVSGTIELERQLLVEYGDLTIAGQTAPGDGICIKGHEFRINADNVIIRFIRFRPGDISGKEYDAITGMRNRNIIIDHCSMSWSTDETVSFYDNENFTLQWCLISESLNNSVHSKGPHGYGGIWGGKNASFIFNILAHHNSRNPRLQGTRYQPAGVSEKVEFINNIVYNWGNKAIYGGENGRYNIINNVFIPGPATSPGAQHEIIEPYMPFGKFFLKGNVFYREGEFSRAGWDHVGVASEFQHNINSVEPFEFVSATSYMEPAHAYDQILARGGASLVRDEVDHRIIREIRKGTYTYGEMGIIDSQNEVGGWPLLRSMEALKDSDGDGIPDEWEIANGLNPGDPADAPKYTLDSNYTNLEIYLNSIVNDLISNHP